MLFINMRLPNSWGSVTIKQYLDIYKILQDNTSDLLDKNAMIISALANVPLKDVYDMDYSKFKEAVADTAFLYDSDIGEKIPMDITIDGIEYRFDPIKPIKKAGDFIDLSHLTKDKDETIYNLHKVMAVLCKPKGEQSFEERSEIFLHKMTMDKCYPLSVFFLNVSIKSAPIIEVYLEKQVQKGMRTMTKMVEEAMEKQHTQSIGGGI